MKNILNRFFVEGFTGMACGLFVTLILGTILQQIGSFTDSSFGFLLTQAGKAAVSLTGAGIGIGVAVRLQEHTLTVLAAATAGMAGAFSGELADGISLVSKGPVVFSDCVDPLAAFIAAFAAIELSRLIIGKTKLDVILAPLAGILGGTLVGMWIGIPLSTLVKYPGQWISWGTTQQPLIMGIVVSVLMGMAAVLPISCAALSVMLNLSGLAAGAATIGCCCSMIGFAAASYRENGVCGLLVQGMGTPLFQFPNILQRPLIWLPSILSSAVLGPVGTLLARMTNSSAGAGLGSIGFMGQIMTWQTMISNEEPSVLLFKILLMHVLLPGLLTLSIANGMRKLNLIKPGDMTLRI